MPSQYDHDPNAILDYNVDWGSGAAPGPWLASGETISTSSWTIPSDLTLVTATKTDNQATAWISGGTAGVVYRITNRIVTSATRQDDRSITLVCKER